MKLTNILIFICIIFCLFGCKKYQEDKIDTTILYRGLKTRCTILKHEGHDYILGVYGSGGIEIVHSESCLCKKGIK